MLGAIKRAAEWLPLGSKESRESREILRFLPTLFRVRAWAQNDVKKERSYGER